MYRRDDRDHRPASRDAGGDRRRRDEAAARAAGDVDVSCHEPSAARRRLRRGLLRLGQHGARSEPDARSDSRVGTVRGRLRKQRRHSRPRVSLAGLRHELPGSWNWKASTSYVTGAHSFKVGYQGTYMTDDRTWSTNTQNMTFQVSNGVPNRLTESISPWINNARAGWHAFFVQEQYTRNRVTVQAALRFDRSSSWFPEQKEGPSRFLPTQIVIPATDGVNAYKDFTPRFGGSWDVFGNGKTAIKANIGKYLEGVGVQLNYANSNP